MGNCCSDEQDPKNEGKKHASHDVLEGEDFD